MNRCLLGWLAGWAVALGAAAADAVRGDLLDGSVLRCRVNTVTDGLAAQLAAARSTNVLAGLVLDLRFAGGPDAPAAGGSFFATNRIPLVILVNGQTTGAATALAIRLRAAGRGLVIGSPEAMPRPDIAVTVSADTEKQLQADPYLTVSNAPAGAGGRPAVAVTNDWLAFVDHTSEAELVRKRVKDGEDDRDPAATPRTPAPPVIQDPALRRAVDLLKALASLQPPRA